MRACISLLSIYGINLQHRLCDNRYKQGNQQGTHFIAGWMGGTAVTDMWSTSGQGGGVIHGNGFIYTRFAMPGQVAKCHRREITVLSQNSLL